MQLNCNIAGDLLPLYLEDMCSDDSKAALEEHLQECPACREKLARMKSSEIIPQMKKQKNRVPIADYTKKVKRHRIQVGICAAFICTAASCLLALCFLVIADMRRLANPTIFDQEAGVYDLTAAELETTAAEMGEYILLTNTQRIQVSISKDIDFDGEIILWNATNKDAPIEIGYGHVDAGNRICIFSHRSASQRYMVTCGGEEQTAVTISDGRIVSFWHSLGNVLKEMTGI